jgi:hypothetical protein
VIGACIQQRFEVGRRNSLTEEKTLKTAAAKMRQQLALFVGFHAFGDYRQTQRAGEGNDGMRNRAIGGVGPDIAHKRAIDFQLIERQALEVGQ